MNTSASNIRLSQLVKKGGCAAKIPADILRDMMGRLDRPTLPDACLVASEHFDDAAVIKISEDLAMVQTVDFFTPIVDSPRSFGKIAATNALSDVYAMGGVPKTALGILGFSPALLDSDVVALIMQGAIESLTQAGASLVGGHSIDDEQLKFGLSVTGFVHPKSIWTNAGSRPGDRLILTKALGTGALTAALKQGKYSEDCLSDAMHSMMQLNAVQSLLDPALLQFIHAATDVTGFGFIGHGMQMAQYSACSFQVDASALPLFEKTIASIEGGYLTRATRSNWTYAKENVSLNTGNNDLFQLIIADPQTSGGLLLSVDQEVAEECLVQLQAEFHHAAIVGRVVDQQKKALYFE